ncbi:MAG: DUF177 domain-containing protein [Clostridia bacterium]|nr:DUF177 domain-containing protein [Clostridia bacterium]
MLDVSQAIRNPGQQYPFRVTQTIAPQEIIGDVVTFDDAEMWGVLSSQEDGTVVVEGELKTVAHAPCSNCLEQASADIAASYREAFVWNGDPEDDEIFTYQGSKLDLEKLAMSYVLLELPMRFSCGKNCKGFRGFYGADNADRQEEMQTKHPFAALQQLLGPEFLQQLDAGPEDCGEASPESSADDHGWIKDEEV